MGHGGVDKPFEEHPQTQIMGQVPGFERSVADAYDVAVVVHLNGASALETTCLAG